MKKKNSIKLLIFCILVSVFLHIFLMLRYSAKSNLPEPPQAQSKDKSSSTDGNDGKTSIWVSPGVVPCESYEGIGVQFNGITGIVSHAAPGAPAHKAGIREGDELITPLWNMNLAFGQVLDVIVLRDGKRLTFTIIVDRICHQ